jgi:hypothetical protein
MAPAAARRRRPIFYHVMRHPRLIALEGHKITPHRRGDRPRCTQERLDTQAAGGRASPHLVCPCPHWGAGYMRPFRRSRGLEQTEGLAQPGGDLPLSDAASHGVRLPKRLSVAVVDWHPGM